MATVIKHRALPKHRLTDDTYPDLARKIAELLGTGETMTSREEIADAVGYSVAQVGFTASTLEHFGGLQRSAKVIGYRPNPKFSQGVGSPQVPIKASSWAIIRPIEDTLRDIRKANWHWTSAVSVRNRATRINAEIVAAKPTVGPRGYEKVWPAKGTYIVERPEDDTKETTVHISGDEAESPFAVLKPLRKDEAAALIAAARQYGQRNAFIEEEISRFAAVGLTLDREAVGMSKDERLEHIGLVMDYIDRLEREATAPATVRADSNEVKQLRAEATELRNQVNRMVREKSDQKTAVEDLLNRYRNEKSLIQRRNDELETDLVRAKRRIHELESRD